MNRQQKGLDPLAILMADDDEDDRQMARDALAATRVRNPIHAVSDGEELLDYLFRRGRYEDPANSPRPGLILLDLNMPRLSGREALTVIKQDPELRQIPVLVLTTSEAEEDILQSYQLGANSFISKPVTFDGLVRVMGSLKNFWLEIVELPGEA